MYRYNVAIWVSYNGREYREDFFINADSSSEAQSLARQKLPAGAKIKEFIFVEKLD